jgi:hypothetical protein
MTGQTPPPVKLSPFNGFLILLLVVVSLVVWIILGTKFLGIMSFFASFLFLWYWTSVEHVDFKQWPQSFLGAFAGLVLAWQSHALPVHYGTTGLIVGLLVIVAALYVQIMNWVPMLLNRSAMLFLTVFAAPALLDKLDFVEAATAIGLGAVFFAGVVKLAFMVAARKR